MEKFSIGDIIAYGNGDTQVFKVQNIVYRHMDDGYDKYYGTGFYGEFISISARHCRAATEEEQNRYRLQRAPI